MSPALAHAIATVGGVGTLPKGGGAIASVLGLVVAVGADGLAGPAGTLVAGLALLASGVWTAEIVLKSAA